MLKSIHRDAYTGVIILIVGFIIINYISEEFIFEEKRLNKISENKFSLKITRYKVYILLASMPFMVITLSDHKLALKIHSSVLSNGPISADCNSGIGVSSLNAEIVGQKIVMHL